MSHVFYRKLGVQPPEIVRAQGIYLYDERGHRYLDACGGAMVVSIGHGVKEIGAAMAAQTASVAYVNGTAFTTPPVEALADFLAAKAPAGVDRAYFLGSGSEAVEAALKLARQYHVERGDMERTIVIARTPGYHGNTLLALSASARAHYRAVYSPWLVDVRMIDAPYPYRAESPDSPAMTGEALETAILEAGPENVAAFIAEPIGGSSTGASVPVPAYYARVREICDRYGVLFIADEVLTGAGRTGTFFALEHFKDAAGKPVVPDIVTLGKGLNGGYAPLSALLANGRLVETLARGRFGGLVHAQTYSHHAVSCAAALAVMKYMERNDLVKRARDSGAYLQRALRALLDEPTVARVVGDVRGIGMLAAVEFVEERETKRPFAREAKFVEHIVARGRENGLVLWPNVGHADGHNGDLVLIAPPYIIERAQIDELVEKLRVTIKDVVEKHFAGPASPAPRKTAEVKS
ncbi:MAG: aspartate aminotransferase family protein [Candidatus Eremiobacteraeota bacterium]|nr:aspartate aminotransferase family protein [Candidatus Eremiobacteraeota bacterium]MBV8365014.1 aspartate aminotransferase family protein [Candidatus Eremiobacteraeota bacterium]